MNKMIRLFYLFLILLLQASCSEGDIFGPKKPPLTGERLNVLHYDLLKEKISSEQKIVIPSSQNIDGWYMSDIGQYTGVYGNISLSDEISKKSNFLLPNFDKSEGSALIIVGDVIYMYIRNTLTAYDAVKKKTLWISSIVKEKEDIISGSISFKNGALYIATGARDIVAVDASNGKEIWRYVAPNVVRNIIVVDNDKLYFTSADNTLTCLDLSGNLIWRYEAAIYSLAANRLYVPNILYQDKLIDFTTAGDLVILNRYDGSVVTQVNLANSAIIGDGSLEKGPLVSPYLDKDHLYILTGEYEYIKIDLSNPQVLWHQAIPNAKSFWVAGDTTFMLTRSDNQLIAINNFDGRVIWAVDLDKKSKKKNSEYYGPILAGNRLILTSREGDLIEYSPENGKEIIRHITNSPTHQMPIIVNNKLYFIGCKGNISIWQ